MEFFHLALLLSVAALIDAHGWGYYGGNSLDYGNQNVGHYSYPQQWHNQQYGHYQQYGHQPYYGYGHQQHYGHHGSGYNSHPGHHYGHDGNYGGNYDKATYTTFHGDSGTYTGVYVPSYLGGLDGFNVYNTHWRRLW